MEEARFTLRIHPILMNKMKHIAKSNGRSVNKEIEQILKWVIDDYERNAAASHLMMTKCPRVRPKSSLLLTIPWICSLKLKSKK